MLLQEMFDRAKPGYQELSSDNSKPQWRESRKTKLTLRQLRKLRKMLDIRNYEYAVNLNRIADQYVPKQEVGGLGAGPTL